MVVLLLKLFYLVYVEVDRLKPNVEVDRPKPNAYQHFASSRIDTLIRKRLRYEKSKLGGFRRGEIKKILHKEEQDSGESIAASDQNPGHREWTDDSARSPHLFSDGDVERLPILTQMNSCHKTSSQSSHDEKEETLQTGILPTVVTPPSTGQGAIACSEMVYVNGYQVRASTAPTLGAIFSKYGDIAANCQYKSASARASLLEFVCDLVQLQSNGVTHIISELEVIENEVSDAEAAKLEVSCLPEHLAKIYEVEEVGQRSSLLKKAKGNSIFVIKAASKELEQRHVELVAAQEGVKEAEKRVNAMKLVSQKIDDTIFEAEEYFLRRRLDGLFCSL